MKFQRENLKVALTQKMKDDAADVAAREEAQRKIIAKSREKQLRILEAERISYGGNLSFKTLREIEITTVVDFISQWPLNKSSGWSRHDIPSFLSRVSDLQQELKLD